MDGDRIFTFSENCINTTNLNETVVLSTDCTYSVNYKDFQDFSFYTVIAVVVGIYFGVKVVRWTVDLFFN